MDGAEEGEEPHPAVLSCMSSTLDMPTHFDWPELGNRVVQSSGLALIPSRSHIVFGLVSGLFPSAWRPCVHAHSLARNSAPAMRYYFHLWAACLDPWLHTLAVEGDTPFSMYISFALCMVIAVRREISCVRVFVCAARAVETRIEPVATPLHLAY